MNEERQAELVSRWLDQPAGAELPEDVDSDVLEAIYALRPERAPAPRLTIDDILAEVIEGPLSSVSETEDEDASALAAAVRDPDEGVDVDPAAMEAVYALRPERAPAPRVSIDDILAGVQTGPFAQRPQGANAPMAAAGPSEAPANVIPMRPRGRWLLPGVGALVAAALALIVVLPTADDLPRGFPAPEPAAQRAEPSAASARAPATAPADTMAEPAPELAEASEPALSPPAPPTDASAGPALAREQGLLGDATTGAATTPSPIAELALAEPAPAEAPPASATTPTLDMDGAGDMPLAAPKATAAEGSWAPLGGAAGSSATASTSTRAAAATTEAVAERGALDEADDAEYEAAPAQEETVVEAARDRGKKLDAIASKPAGRQAAPAAPAAAPAPSRSLAMEAKERAAEARKDEAAGADPTASLAEADAAIAAGDLATAEALLRPLCASSDRRVAAGAARRLGQLLLDQGRLSEADAVVRRGLEITPASERAVLQALAAEISRRHSSIPEIQQ